METVDEITRRKINLNKKGVYRIAVKYADDQLVYGYTRHIKNLTRVVFYNKDGNSFSEIAIGQNFPIFYSAEDSHYHCEINIPEKVLIQKKFQLIRNAFPYSFERKYEAIENFDLFYNKQMNTEEYDFPIANVFKYTFGLEFETSMGIIPEIDCFKSGLIPLRDGSITGVEYATVKLEGLKGFNLLKKQLELLRNHTHFNKDCSLHVHLGGFPLDSKKLWRLYKTIYNITEDLYHYVPLYSFNTEKFKSNGKSYCSKLPRVSDFSKFFSYITGHSFLGSFTQPHPNDVTRERKWQIPQRYMMCNFVNMFCYNVNKTIEFRFLTPTFNMEKILTWLYIFNAILIYAETCNDTTSSLDTILRSVYPKDLYIKLNVQLFKLSTLRINQSNNGDNIGADLIMENKIFDMNKII